MKKIKEYKELIVVIIFILGAFLWFRFKNIDNVNYDNEIRKQDLIIKCQELYNVKHDSLEKARYGNEEADSVIWSDKTKSCLAYYYIPEHINNESFFLFEVWDYSNDDLVLSYSSSPSSQCMYNNVKLSMQNFIYKYNKTLEGSGCDLILMDDGIDLLTNFEKSMSELGFKK
ncbi:hypothetical protein IT400_00095 [Candidatus Nomurabacteria bacterium]|nr:hypothetical protein [Candidatus Nomurabacteria bacterium]